MFKLKVYGFQSESRSLCLSCAERIYKNNLEEHLNADNSLIFTESDRPAYAQNGLLCDDCLKWIFQPEVPQAPWWLVEPEPEKHLRLLAPFADFLETLQIDVTNFRHISTR